MRIGVITAMDKEYALVRELLDGVTETESAAGKYAAGKLGAGDIILHACGIGKVNAAVGTAHMITEYMPNAVVSTGVAGGASVSVDVGDVVASSRTCYHDVYCGADAAYGQVIGMPAVFDTDGRLLAAASALHCGTTIRTGLTVTGDWFVDTRTKMREIAEMFPDAVAVDMESAAIAHVCRRYSVPFISFRIISDVPLKDHGAKQYFDFWRTAAASSFEVTRAFLNTIITEKLF